MANKPVVDLPVAPRLTTSLGRLAAHAEGSGVQDQLPAKEAPPAVAEAEHPKDPPAPTSGRGGEALRPARRRPSSGRRAPSKTGIEKTYRKDDARVGVYFTEAHYRRLRQIEYDRETKGLPSSHQETIFEALEAYYGGFRE